MKSSIIVIIGSFIEHGNISSPHISQITLTPIRSTALIMCPPPPILSPPSPSVFIYSFDLILSLMECRLSIVKIIRNIPCVNRQSCEQSKEGECHYEEPHIFDHHNINTNANMNKHRIKRRMIIDIKITQQYE